ncbi:MAG: hypothetical protein M3Y34_05770 [Actinomycetota bacterium]|nr:hypothetical protein [Actinomycetota bacterium]
MVSKRGRASAAVATAFALIAGTAWAGEAQTEIKITNEIDVAGKVQSSVNACKDERKVVLLKKRSGKDRKMGTDTADSAGRFSFGNPGLGPGRYYVKAKPIEGTCAKGLSEIWRISNGA